VVFLSYKYRPRCWSMPVYSSHLSVSPAARTQCAVPDSCCRGVLCGSGTTGVVFRQIRDTGTIITFIDCADLPGAALQAQSAGPVLARPVQRVLGPALTAGASYLSRMLKEVPPYCEIRCSRGSPRRPKLFAYPPSPPERRHQSYQKVSASTTVGRTGVSGMTPALQGTGGVQAREARVQEARWRVVRAASPLAPTSPIGLSKKPVKTNRSAPSACCCRNIPWKSGPMAPRVSQQRVRSKNQGSR
jgi:hypothetical protein